MHLQRGFTLIELLVVIAIIGVLAGIVLAALGATRQRGQVSGIGANLAGLRAQAEIFYQANGTYNGFCASTAANGGNRGLIAARNAAGMTSAPVIDAAGADEQVTCNDGVGGWAAEVPIPDSVTPADQYWCVDYQGFSGTTTSTVLDDGGATDYVCS